MSARPASKASKAASSARTVRKSAARAPAAKRTAAKRTASKARTPAGAGALLVFVGPSLPAAEAQRLCPQAEIRPPIAVGELLAIARGRKRPGCVAILDGYFERMAAVWHKEILVALERGIAVYGAASMGALRAAELAPWGMQGMGEVYRAFASGQLEADDEVAVAHLPAEQDHRPISDALVNLRDGLAGAVAAGVLGQPMANKLVEAARQRPYRERSWRQLLEDGSALGLGKARRNQLASWLAATQPDRKAADARLLLSHLASRGWQQPAPIAVPRTWALEQLIAIVDAR